MLDERGLTTRPSPSRPAQAVSRSRLALILRNPYYTGVISLQGQALRRTARSPFVSKETFLKVQEVLDHRNRKGDRDIIHFHYLKGMLYCGACLEAPVDRVAWSTARTQGTAARTSTLSAPDASASSARRRG
ncbi:hypothetical protein JM654_15460 [Microbacterium oxydans]|nr:hypothetical protein [Microbacterium oxydans]